MIFNLTEDQIDFKNAAIDFAKRNLNEGVKEFEVEGKFNWEGWRKCAEFGIHGLAMPEDYGGLEGDILTCVAAMEGLGYACNDSGLLFAINSQIWTCQFPILKFGTEEQKRKYLPNLVSGEIVGGHAITEPNSGSDVFSITCKAKRMGDTYILNGTKVFITNAPIADLLLVFAVTDETRGFAGITAFIVEKNFPGFSTGKTEDMMGLRSCPIGEVILKDCEVPVENRLGLEGAGSAVFNAAMELKRSCFFASHVGAMEKELELCIQHSKNRKQFGNPIGKYQAISHKIAEMKMRIELSRLILYKVAWLKSQNKRAPLESAMAKLFISESYVATSFDALQIHGAQGYSREYDFERNLRDAIAGKIYSGTSEIQKNLIASLIGL